MINENQKNIYPYWMQAKTSAFLQVRVLQREQISNLKIKQYEKVIQKANIILFSTSKGS